MKICKDCEKIVNIFKKAWKMLRLKNFLKTWKILRRLKSFLKNLYKIFVKFWRNENGNRNFKESQKNFHETQKYFGMH